MIYATGRYVGFAENRAVEILGIHLPGGQFPVNAVFTAALSGTIADGMVSKAVGKTNELSNSHSAESHFRLPAHSARKASVAAT